MTTQTYTVDELKLAFCYRVYFRWQTHRLQPTSALKRLDQSALQALSEPYGIHTLECAASESDLRAMVSLHPRESVSQCASKLKGRVSHWLHDAVGATSNVKLIGRGYFACTTGASNAQTIQSYLDQQGEHHGYSGRARPPIFVREYPTTPSDKARLATDHAVTILQFHIVLSTWRRNGVFGQGNAPAVAEAWRERMGLWRIVLRKVSFVPDHVHLAVCVHPTVSPAELVVSLMNTAQQVMWKRSESAVTRARAERLFQPSAYVGSYGDLQSAKLRTYIQRWEQDGL